MGIALKMYKQGFIQRFDKDGIIPYLSNEDFEGLNFFKGTFKNSIGLNISYFAYYYDNYKKDKYVLFCPGIGPGHTQYTREIEKLASCGYFVLTLDYTGCSESEGESLLSVNAPTRDVNDLLCLTKNGKLENFSFLKDMEIVVVGHSLGAYTALNTINIQPFIKKAVIISGFIDVISEMKGLSHIYLSILFSDVKRYERKTNKEYSNIKNMKYLKETNDDILFIHSMDDSLVPYKTSTYRVYKKYKDKKFEFVIVNGKDHNPNYELDSLKYMKETFSELNSLVNSGKIKTIEEKQAFMSNKDIWKMTNQDEDIFKKIIDFIEK